MNTQTFMNLMKKKYLAPKNETYCQTDRHSDLHFLKELMQFMLCMTLESLNAFLTITVNINFRAKS